MQIFLDQESSDIKCIVSRWLRRQPDEVQLKLHQWIDDYFFKALEWVLEQGAAVVQTTTAGVVNNALSHLVGVASKAEFVAAAVRGFGSNLMLEQRTELAKHLYSWAKVEAADHRRPLESYYDRKRGEMRLHQVVLKTPTLKHLLSPVLRDASNNVRFPPPFLVGRIADGLI